MEWYIIDWEKDDGKWDFNKREVKVNQKQKKHKKKIINNGLEKKVEEFKIPDGFVEISSDDMMHDKYFTCGYLRNPITNGKGIVKGSCSIKIYNNKKPYSCIRYKNHLTGTNCNVYNEMIEKK